MHPGYASEHGGSDHLVDLLRTLRGSRCRKDTMIVVTYDDHRVIVVTYDEFGGQLMRAAPTRTQDEWEAFLRELDGTPRWVVTDMDAALRNAVAAVFPRDGDRAPDVRLCELHLRRSMENALAPLAGQPQHPVMRAFKYALMDHCGWTFFEAQVKHSDQHGSPALPAMMRWLRRYGPQVGAQMRTRSKSYSTSSRRSRTSSGRSALCSPRSRATECATSWRAPAGTPSEKPRNSSTRRHLIGRAGSSTD